MEFTRRILTGCGVGVAAFTLACSAQTPAESAPAPTPAASPAPSLAPPAPNEASALLTREEVAAAQGCEMTLAQTSAGKSGPLRLVQCFFGSAEPNKAVSLAVMRTDPDAPVKRTTKEYWRETFARYAEADEDDEKEEAVPKKKETGVGGVEQEKEEEKKSRPLRIEGLGDDAYWMGNSVGGALYVLKGDAFIRLSLGGPDKQEVRMSHSKALAEKALARL